MKVKMSGKVHSQSIMEHPFSKLAFTGSYSDLKDAPVFGDIHSMSDESRLCLERYVKDSCSQVVDDVTSGRQVQEHGRYEISDAIDGAINTIQLVRTSKRYTVMLTVTEGFTASIVSTNSDHFVVKLFDMEHKDETVPRDAVVHYTVLS